MNATGGVSASVFTYLNKCVLRGSAENAESIIMSFIATKLLATLPLSVLVLGVASRRWWRQRLFKTASHADVFAYNAAALEIVFALAAVFYFCSFYAGFSEGQVVGIYLSSLVWAGEIFLHVLTCVERYLAAVHPVTYLGLRQSGGVRIRNISIVCVWSFSCVWLGLVSHILPNIPYTPYFCFLVLSLAIISFLNASVLCVLVRPRPGEEGRDRKRLNQSKKRAFVTITAILGVMIVFFCGMLVGLTVEKSQVLGSREGCVVLLSMYWLTLPNSLVLPLLFLSRVKRVQ